MMKIAFHNPAIVYDAAGVASGEIIEAFNSIVENDFAAMLKTYLEQVDHNTEFSDLCNGQTFFYSGKRKDGFFIKTSKSSALMLAPNVIDAGIFASMYGQTHKFKTNTMVNVVSMTSTFAPPNQLSNDPSQ